MAKRKFKYVDKYRRALDGFKLTLAQTEKVLTAHGLGMLRNGGTTWREGAGWPVPSYGCIMQIADNIPNCDTAAGRNNAVAAWFDQNYNSGWTTDEFLDAMEKVGLF